MATVKDANASTVLVIDTCGAEGYVGLATVRDPEHGALSGHGTLPERRLRVRATQEELLPSIAAVLGEAGLTLAELSAVAVVSGPGSFTGVRIGLAAAKGLCEAAGLRLVVLSRLRVLAGAAVPAVGWAWLEAGRGEVYCGRGGNGASGGVVGDGAGIDVAGIDGMGEGQVLSLERAVALAGGDAVAVCEDALAAAGARVVRVEREAFARTLRAAAAEAVRGERWADPALSDAMYLRVPDAELALRARQAAALALRQG